MPISYIGLYAITYDYIGSELGPIIRAIIVPIIVPYSEWLQLVKFDSQSEHD